ncbi:ABC transporter ATP-binding protein [Deltaproteobacteria bacterium]|nr:ABC transporter ATP-binding protein [Deltaproteobacteria bacterium]
MTDSGSDVVYVKDLKKNFNNFAAVDGISFAVKKGEVFGFLGPNGAGKSTTIRMLCGIITPSSGEGWVAGHNILTESEEIKHSIGYMSQKFSLYEDMTPFENIRFYLGIYSVPEEEWGERIEWALDMTRLKDVRNRITRDLPTGWRQRLALGCALLHKPEILFLDEPTSGVDPITRRHFWEFINHLAGEGITIFVTTHYMDEALNCGRIVIINEGRIVVTGTPTGIIQDILPDSPEADLNDVFIRLMSGSVS